MTTTEEAVETAEQARLLIAEGCAEGQGHQFSRPRPAEEIALILGEGRPRQPAPDTRAVTG